jgi:putative ABC transport system permease protein
MATIQSLITERKAEIGLMKALGAGNNNIKALFMSEAGLIGLAGGLIGYGIGAALAQAIGQSVFGTPIDLSLVGFVLVMSIGFFIAVLGVLFFTKYVTEIEPANTLRGE